VADQRDALLDAARHVFAREGYAGASLRSIAREAHVTPALASYYFGDKAGMLQAVIEQRVAPLMQALSAALTAAGDEPLQQLEAFVRNYTATAADNPWLPQLIVREVLSEQGVLRDTFAQRFAGGLTARLRELVQRGQQAGVLRRSLDPPAVVMSLMSLCVFPFIARPLVSGALGIQVDAGSAARLAEHHWSLFLHGVEVSK
jgi:TetR/AcrR family transcriptional regulator